MTEAEILFNQAVLRNLRAWATIQNFRDSLMGVIDVVMKRQEAQIGGMYDSLAYDPAYTHLLVNPRDFAQTVDRAQFVKTASGEMMEGTTSSLDAATVVFAHSVLDAAAIDYCRVTATAAPDDWAPDLKNRQIPLSEVAKSSYEELVRRKLEDRLQELERESLPTKIDRLFARCQPPAGWSPMSDYKFDPETMTRLDNQRHEIVHGAALGRPLKHYPLSYESLWYLQKTSMYLMGLVNLRYGLQIDPTYLTEAFRNPPGQPAARSSRA